MKRAIFAAVVLTTISTHQAVAQSPATVHVFTRLDPSGLVDTAATNRRRAVDDIQKRLAGRREIRLVPSSNAADILLEVMSVEEEPVWMPTPIAAARPLKPGDPLPEGTRPRQVARATLTYRTFTTDFAEAAGSTRTSATVNLARSIERWVRENAKALATLTH